MTLLGPTHYIKIDSKRRFVVPASQYKRFKLDKQKEYIPYDWIFPREKDKEEFDTETMKEKRLRERLERKEAKNKAKNELMRKKQILKELKK